MIKQKKEFEIVIDYKIVVVTKLKDNQE